MKPTKCVQCCGDLAAYERESNWCEVCCNKDLARLHFFEQYEKRISFIDDEVIDIFKRNKADLEDVEAVDEFIDWQIKKYDLVDLSKR